MNSDRVDDIMTAARPIAKPTVAPPGIDASWGGLIPEEQWGVFSLGITALEANGVPYLVHGALALGIHTGHWRNTKDVDVIAVDKPMER